MKLFHKIFLCFVLIFGISFQAAGYLLISFAYENVIEQEKKYAFQEFQHNKYILQSVIYMKPELFEVNESNVPEIKGSFTVPSALYNTEGKCIFSNTTVQPGIPYFDAGEDNEINFKMLQTGNESYIFVYDYVKQGETEAYLITETDISAVADAQKSMINYFQRIYLIILCIGFPVIFLLTKVLTGSINKVRKAAKTIAEGSYMERISVSGNDEIGELASDFNQMAQKVEEKIAELSEAARQKEDFAANFAHELKTPLTSVIGYADMLYQRDLPREQVKSAAGYILNEGMRLEALSLKLMDLFVMDKQDFLLESMGVQDIFDNLKHGLEPLCEKYGVILHIDIKEGTIDADYDLFKTMLLNIVDNSIKGACKDIWITGRQDKYSYQLIIKDNGKGIPPKELGRITEAFYMVDKSRARKQHGAGLGLALVSKVVELHKAKMSIESDGETGTSISIEFHCA